MLKIIKFIKLLLNCLLNYLLYRLLNYFLIILLTIFKSLIKLNYYNNNIELQFDKEGNKNNYYK